MTWLRLRRCARHLAVAWGAWGAWGAQEDMKRASKSLLSVLAVVAVSVMAAPPQATARPTFPFALSLAGLVGARSPPSAATAEGAVISAAAAAAAVDDAGGAKPYSGLRRKNDSLLMIYYYDQTVAVVELGPKKLLLNCELIEVNENENRDKLLHRLKRINRPLEITFKQMVKLMWQCQQVESIGWQPYRRLVSERSGDSSNGGGKSGGGGGGRQNARSSSANAPARRDTEASASNDEFVSLDTGSLLDSGPFSLLSGIIPGTKWCGTGDIASSYHDLGKDRRLDRCCRTHDLCPTKVRAFSSRYNLTNKSLYSKSHCVCDDMLFSCLKNTNTSASQVMGSIYFNLVQVPCLESDPEGQLRFRRAKDGF